jgi:hypothetical protein
VQSFPRPSNIAPAQVKNKVYRKFKTNEFFNAIRIACMASKDDRYLAHATALDKAGKERPKPDQLLSLELLRNFLYRSCGLRLTSAAFGAFVKLFDSTGEGVVEFSHFSHMVRT